MIACNIDENCTFVMAERYDDANYNRIKGFFSFKMLIHIQICNISSTRKGEYVYQCTLAWNCIRDGTAITVESTTTDFYIRDDKDLVRCQEGAGYL